MTVNIAFNDDTKVSYVFSFKNNTLNSIHIFHHTFSFDEYVYYVDRNNWTKKSGWKDNKKPEGSILEQCSLFEEQARKMHECRT